MERHADSIWNTDRDPLNRLGQRWAGGTINQVDWRTQASALAALTVTEELEIRGLRESNGGVSPRALLRLQNRVRQLEP